MKLHLTYVAVVCELFYGSVALCFFNQKGKNFFIEGLLGFHGAFVRHSLLYCFLYCFKFTLLYHTVCRFAIRTEPFCGTLCENQIIFSSFTLYEMLLGVGRLSNFIIFTAFTSSVSSIVPSPKMRCFMRMPS